MSTHRIGLSTLAFLLIFSPRFGSAQDEVAETTTIPTLLGQPVADYQSRRKDLMATIADEAGEGKVLIVLRGANRSDREDFEDGRFRQGNWFAYLTGVDIPGAFLVLDPETGKDVLYLPLGRLGTSFSGGDRPIPEPGEASSKAFGVAEVASTGRLLGDIFGTIQDPLTVGAGRRDRGATIYTIDPAPDAENTGPDARFIRFLKAGLPSTSFKDVAPAISSLRRIKTEAEIDLIQKAIDVTGEGERAVAGSIHPGVYEYELEGALIGAFLRGGAMRPGFASIVGSGPNATIPHYFRNDRQAEDGDLVVVDIGAEYQNYTADITRTFPVNGKFSDRQRELYQLVLDAQEHAASQIKPGETRLGTMTGVASAYLRQSPLRAKDRQGREQTMDRFFIHGLGHYLGMDVHDVGGYGEPLVPGAVFTIEPGLYIPSENIGIRIEDDYLMTEDGLVKLSEGIPSTPDAVERLIAEESAKAEPATETVGGQR